MKTYILGRYLKKNNFQEVAKSSTKDGIVKAKIRFEKIYKPKKFSIITLNKKIKL
jgi:hypothetical protein